MNLEELIADTAGYFIGAYLPQAFVQGVTNTLVRRDLKNAIDAKCGPGGATNAADLEKRLLASDPMSPSRFFNIRTSDWGAYRLRIPFTQRRIPFFGGPRNPFLLTWSAGYSVENHLHKKELALEIKDPIERQKALDAIGNKDLYWAGFLTSGAFFLADSNRGFALTSRAPGISRWSALGSNSPYQQLLQSVTSDIQCKDQGGTGGRGNQSEAPEAATAPENVAPEANPVSATADEAAPVVTDPDASPGAVAAQMCSEDFIPQTQAAQIPDSALVRIEDGNLARHSLAVYGKAGAIIPSAPKALAQGLSLAGGSANISPISTVNYSAAPIVRPLTNFAGSMARPVFVFEPALVAK